MTTSDYRDVTPENLAQVAAELNAWIGGFPVDVGSSNLGAQNWLFGTVVFGVHAEESGDTALSLVINGLPENFVPNLAVTAAGSITHHIYPGHSIVRYRFVSDTLEIRIIVAQEWGALTETLTFRLMLPCRPVPAQPPLLLSLDTAPAVASGMYALLGSQPVSITHMVAGGRHETWSAVLSPALLLSGAVAAEDSFWTSNSGDAGDQRFYVATARLQDDTAAHPARWRRDTIIHRFSPTRPGQVIWSSNGVTINAYDPQGSVSSTRYALRGVPA